MKSIRVIVNGVVKEDRPLSAFETSLEIQHRMATDTHRGCHVRVVERAGKRRRRVKEREYDA